MYSTEIIRCENVYCVCSTELSLFNCILYNVMRDYYTYGLVYNRLHI